MIQGTIQQVKDLLTRRRAAYRRVFKKDNQSTEIVLKDLAKFCRAHESTVHKKEHITFVLEGRREVFTRIQQQLNLSDEDIWKLYQLDDRSDKA